MIMPVRVSDPTGYALFSNLAGGVTWAADHGASVANMSYEVSASSAVTCAAQYFVSKGGVVAASAGNGGKFVSASPNPYILTVGATDPNDARYSWSNCGNNIDLVAPGCSFTTNMGGGYGVGCGTSYSAPMVAGAAALLQSAQPSLTPAGVSTCLKQSAHDLGATGWDTTFGYGRLDLSAALVLAGSGGSTDTTPPVVSITAPATGTTVSGNVPVYLAATDNVSVVSVSVAVDGAAFCTMTAGPYACTWNSASCANGIHTLTATARDAAGNTSPASVTVTVSNLTDTTPPTGGGGSLPLRCSCPSVPLRDFEGMLLMFVRKDC